MASLSSGFPKHRGRYSAPRERIYDFTSTPVEYFPVIDPLWGLTMSANRPGQEASGEDGWVRAPEDECKHGRLEGDRTPICGCFSNEKPPSQVGTQAKARKAARAKGKGEERGA